MKFPQIKREVNIYLYNILIAEDESLERRALKHIISKKLNHVTICGEAKNGLEAIDMAKTNNPDIILMNIDMPELNGLEVQKEILKFLPHVMTIMITSFDDFAFIQSALRLKVIDYLLMPVKPNELIGSITRGISIMNLQRNQETVKECNNTLIQEAIRFIENNFEQDINLESASAFVHLNSQYFCRYFKSQTGINFTDYLSSFRIKKAKEMLTDTYKNITEISMSVGYTDSSYFGKVFLRVVGMTPNKFRAQNKKQQLLIL
jgi:Response regulator containing CheY-like receiver domain and AraC-type DNA-binding domain